MKTLLAASSLIGLLPSCLGQGLINFYNSPSTPVVVLASGISLMDGRVGNYEFALLTSPVGAQNYTFAGVYATNTTTPGVFTGGSDVAVPGWPAGTARDFAVFGWDVAHGGVNFNPSWLNPDLSLGPGYPFPMLSGAAIGTGVAGGVASSGTVPTLNLFGGPTGIQSGFGLGSPVGSVPEPSSVALMALGAAALLIRYCRKPGTS